MEVENANESKRIDLTIRRINLAIFTVISTALVAGWINNKINSASLNARKDEFISMLSDEGFIRYQNRINHKVVGYRYISGSVSSRKDGKSEAIQGATAYLVYNEIEFIDTTNLQGQFVFSIPIFNTTNTENKVNRKSYSLVVRKVGYKDAFETCALNPNSKIFCDIVLTPI